MLQCVPRRVCFRALQRVRTIGGSPLSRALLSSSSAVRATGDSEAATPRGRRPPTAKYRVFRRLPYPEGSDKDDPSFWANLLEGALPPHLRERPQSSVGVELDAEETAEVLLAAQGQPGPSKSIDLLFFLGFDKGRWSAVVWLIKHLVEALGANREQPQRLSQTIASWTSDHPLDMITGTKGKIQNFIKPRTPSQIAPHASMSLHELTDELKPEAWGLDSGLRRDALGQIWRSLARMTIACADGEVKPEILEIIAYLHHMEIMPRSIYNQRPPSDSFALGQPPMLNLLSSRILMSLTDAAWRAHEKLVVAEAEAKGGKYFSLRPEIPGTAYKVNVAGLRPEVWLELILWSCLHGGWILEGTRILRLISAERWTPISWRSSVPDHGADTLDLDKLFYNFNTRKPSTMDLPEQDSNISVAKTVSSEIVNAYIDAMLGSMSYGVGERGVGRVYVLQTLRVLRDLLSRAGLSLEAGSWDAVVLRYMYQQEDDGLYSLKNFADLINLSPAMGEELNSTTQRNLPPYVLDGSAAMTGLLHRAIRSRIKAGDARGAQRLFKTLHDRANENKRRSVIDFLQSMSNSESQGKKEDSGLFTSRFTGIEYPGFDMRIPPTILGPFMELITDSEAYDLGRWLIHNDEVDGPIIPPRLYGHPIMAPVLFRFAVETDDNDLLGLLTQINGSPGAQKSSNLRGSVLGTMFNALVTRKRWDAAVRILDHLKAQRVAPWNVHNLAHVARALLLQLGDAKPAGQNKNPNLEPATMLCQSMLEGQYEIGDHRDRELQEQVLSLLTMLALVDQQWADFCKRYLPSRGHRTFALPTNAVNLIMEGIVKTYGSATGRRILGTLWSHSTRSNQSTGQHRSGEEEGEGEARKRFVPRFKRPDVVEDVAKSRNVIPIPSDPEQSMVIYNRIRPNLMTISIILDQALKELNGTEDAPKRNPIAAQGSPWKPGEKMDVSPTGVALWAVHCLRSLRMADEDITRKLHTALSEHGLDQFRAQLGDLVKLGRGREDVGELVPEDDLVHFPEAEDK